MLGRMEAAGRLCMSFIIFENGISVVEKKERKHGKFSQIIFKLELQQNLLPVEREREQEL